MDWCTIGIIERAPTPVLETVYKMIGIEGKVRLAANLNSTQGEQANSNRGFNHSHKLFEKLRLVKMRNTA